MWLALALLTQPVAPAPDLPVSPPEQGVIAYENEWRTALSAWRACRFPRETDRYLRAMADTLIQAKAYDAQGFEPIPVEPEFSSWRQPDEDCLRLAAEMDPIITAFREAQIRPGLLRAWRAPQPR